MKKIYECKGKCLDRIVDYISLFYKKCIKRRMYTSELTEKQIKEILKILRKNL